ncbi:MAG TPA: hypothetical protein PLK30_16545 [Blastocatellia bacterium]|nr:hypothetical protein [Blastocatellia bacterium]
MSVQIISPTTLEPTIDPALKLLIEQQGVKPITDINKLSALWPADDEPDDLLAFILAERIERNLTAEGKSEGE